MVTFPGYKSTGNQTASGHVVTINVVFGGSIVATDGANDVVFTVYSGDSAVDANAITPKDMTIKATENYGGLFVGHPIRCPNGIYVSISGGSPNYVVYYTDRAEALYGGS